MFKCICSTTCKLEAGDAENETIHYSIANRGKAYKDMKYEVCLYLKRQQKKHHCTIQSSNDNLDKKIQKKLSILVPQSALLSTHL